MFYSSYFKIEFINLFYFNLACFNDSITKKCLLKLEYKKGITIYDAETEKVLHYIPFKYLSSTKDDGAENIIFINEKNQKVNLKRNLFILLVKFNLI